MEKELILFRLEGLQKSILEMDEENLNQCSNLECRNKQCASRTSHNDLQKIIFLLECYRLDADPQLLHAIEKWLSGYRAKEEQTSNNFTFLQGKSGLIYSYLLLYQLRREDRYLSEALELAQVYKNGYAPLFTYAGHNSLFDGMAGVLLVLCHLFAASKENWLIPLIENLSLKLLKNAQLHTHGLHWNALGEDQYLRNYGYAFGNAGIAFAWLQLGKLFENPAFYQLSKWAFQFEDHCRQIAAEAHDAMSPSRPQDLFDWGIAGILVPRLEFNQLVEGMGELSAETIDLSGPIEDGLEIIQQTTTVDAAQIDLGLLLLHADPKVAKRGRYLEQLVDKISHTNFQSQELQIKAGYFLARYLQRGDASGIDSWFPLIKQAGSIGFDQLDLDSPLFSDFSEINDLLLRRSFPKAYVDLQRKFSQECASFCDEPHLNLYTDFVRFTELLLQEDTANEGHQDLQLMFDKDRYIVSTIMNDLLFPPDVLPDNGNAIDEIVNNLILPDDLFIKLEFKRSDKVWFFQKDPTISQVGRLDYDDLSQLVLGYGNRSFAFYKAPNGFKEQRLGIGKLILDRFQQSVSVKDVHETLYTFLSNQMKEVVDVLDMGIDQAEGLSLYQKSKLMTIQSVKYFYEEGILELSSVN